MGSCGVGAKRFWRKAWNRLKANTRTCPHSWLLGDSFPAFDRCTARNWARRNAEILRNPTFAAKTVAGASIQPPNGRQPPKTPTPNQTMKPRPHLEMRPICLPPHPAVAYLFLVRLRPYMPSKLNAIFGLMLCFSGLTGAMAVTSSSSDASHQAAEARDSWLAAFKSKDVGAAVGFYASDAVFLQPSGERIEGNEAIRELYKKVVNTFDTDLVLRSRNLEVSANLAYDSGEYEETLTNRATGQKQHFRGQYVMIFRLGSDGHWKIIQRAWTVAPNPV